MEHEPDKVSVQNHQPEPEHERDLERERLDYERIIERQSEASRDYTNGKFWSA